MSFPLLALLFCACNDIKENPVIKVPVRCVMMDIATRSAVDETLLEDINLYLVNTAGDLAYHKYHNKTTELEIPVYNGMEGTLYVIANAGRALVAKSEEELVNMVYTITSIDNITTSGGGLLMSGKTSSLLFEEGEIVEVVLERCISKISVSCNFDELDKDVSIEIKRVTLKNVPNAISLFKESRIEDVSASIDGNSVELPTGEMLKEGIHFYQFENMQGTLHPDNVDQRLKVWPADDVHSKICSYIEMEAIYCSPRKRGDIVYRFYLGRDMTSNYDVIRNTRHAVVVSFKGEGSVEETTWRVENGSIQDLVTDITVEPGNHTFDKWGDTIVLSANILPLTAYERSVTWKSSDESVATVDENGTVTAIGDGNCTITATSCDGTGICGNCTIKVDGRIPVTSVSLSKNKLDMYNGMAYNFVATVYPSDATCKDIIWRSSNEQMVTIDSTGVARGGKEIGNCYIYAISADNNEIMDRCKITLGSLEYVSIVGDRTIYMKVGETYQLTWHTRPADAVVTFKSNNSPAVTVDEYGVLRAIKPSNTIIDMFVFCSRDFYYVVIEE